MSAWLPTAPCTPGACVEAFRRAAAVPRAVLRLTAIAALLLAGTAVVCVPSGLRHRLSAALVRRWCRWVVRAVGVRGRVTGAAASEGGLLLVVPHVSWLDIPLPAAVRPARMLAKSEVRCWPVAGTPATRAGALFIERDRLRALPVTVDAVARAPRWPSSPRAAPGAVAPGGPSAGRCSRPPWTPGRRSSRSGSATGPESGG